MNSRLSLRRWFAVAAPLSCAVILSWGCGSSGDADGSSPSTGPDGQPAVPCSGSGECAPPNPYCGVVGICVECLGDANCDGGEVCSPAGICSECTSDADCGGDNPYCSVSEGECVECVTDANCGTGEACDTLRNRCELACSSSAQCPGGENPYCSETRGICVECVGDGNCGGDQGICDVAVGRCVECISDTACGSGAPFCQTQQRECVECLTDANCGPGERCDSDFECQG
jgi:Cys-rich repeat protein